MNRAEKAAVVDEVADQIGDAGAILALDYRGISAKQSGELRAQLRDAGARFQVVKNRLMVRAVEKAGAERLKPLLGGPTALAIVRDGDAVRAATVVATFRRRNGLLAFKGGVMGGDFVTAERMEEEFGALVVEEEAAGAEEEVVPTVDVILTGAGDKKVAVIKAVRAATGLGLRESKALVDGAPQPISAGVERDEAERLKLEIEALGGTVALE